MVSEVTERASEVRRCSEADDMSTQAFGLLLEAHARLTATLEAGLSSDDVGLSLSEVEVMIELGRCPDEAVRPRDLARRCVMTSSGCTRLINRLEGQLLVERTRTRGDGRGLDIRLTGRGKAVLAALLPGHNQRLVTYFSGILSFDEIVALREILAKVATAN